MTAKDKFKEKLKSLTSVVSSIEKQFGAGAVMFLGSAPSAADIPSIPSGSLGIDRALGIGGFPRGRIIEIYGPESSGKTTLTLHAIAEIQKQGGVCAFIDAEHALDVTYAKKLGVNADQLLVSQPDYGEQALEITNRLVESGGVDLIVVDSVAALTPKSELEGEMGDHHVGLQARMMSQAMRKLTAGSNREATTIVFINQIRHKIGVSFGSPETTTGGNALKFYASVRVDVRRIGKIKDKENIVGNKTRVKIVKNKMAPPFRQAEFEIRFGEGISRYCEVTDLGVEQGIIDKAGAWFSFQGERLGQGREKTIATLKTNPQLVDKISDLIKENLWADLAETPDSQTDEKSKTKEQETTKKGKAA